MVNCDFCSWEKDKEVTMVTNPNSACENCGFATSYSFRVVYKGVFEKPGEQRSHGFRVLDKTHCPECGIEIKGFWVPCGGSYIWEFGAIEQQTLDRLNEHYHGS